MSKAKDEPLVYSIKRTADLLSLSVPTIYRMIGAGKLRTVRIGQRNLIPAGDIRALVGLEEAA